MINSAVEYDQSCKRYVVERRQQVSFTKYIPFLIQSIKFVNFHIKDARKQPYTLQRQCELEWQTPSNLVPGSQILNATPPKIIIFW